MKQIVIHAKNEELTNLEPLADKLRRQGAQVRCLAIKWMERDPKAEIALCPEHLLPVVERLYAGSGVAVRVIEADVMNEVPAPAPVVVEEPKPLEVAVKLEDVGALMEIDAENGRIVIHDAKEEPAPAPESKEEDPKPHHPAPRRRAK